MGGERSRKKCPYIYIFIKSIHSISPFVVLEAYCYLTFYVWTCEWTFSLVHRTPSGRVPTT